MVVAKFEFSLGAFDLCRLNSVHPCVDSYPAPQLPVDFADVVDIKGDRFRDTFTRMCLYLAGRHIYDVETPAVSMVVVGTEYGNLEAMLRLQRQAHAADKTISAQQFPHATTSSASTFINIAKTLTGGNVTLNAGCNTPVTALLHAMLHLQAHAHGRSHVFVGDAYCEESVSDVCKRTHSTCRITPGVCYASLASGTVFQAELAFGDRAFDICIGGASHLWGVQQTEEHNGAFALNWLLSMARDLSIGETVSLGTQAAGRRAAVRITRQQSA